MNERRVRSVSAETAIIISIDSAEAAANAKLNFPKGRTPAAARKTKIISLHIKSSRIGSIIIAKENNTIATKHPYKLLHGQNKSTKAKVTTSKSTTNRQTNNIRQI